MEKSPRQHQIEALEAIEKINEGIIQLPTGSGKTYIQSLAIINNLNKAKRWSKKQNEIPVFVVLGPRIMLCDQLYNEVKTELVQQNIDIQYLIVNSGNLQDKKDEEWKDLSPTYIYRELTSTTSSVQIREEYEKTKREDVPLIIFSTYDSAERIMDANLPVYMVLADEAHYLVSEEFSWIAEENKSPEIKQFQAYRKYYFTATLKDTASDKGLGMNNEELFGPIIYQKSPAELIKAGEILRPRIHLVHVNSDENDDEINADATAIVDGFTEHRIHNNIGTKLLVITKGSEHLNDIVNHPKIQRLLRLRPALQIFDISSEYKPRINGKEVKRKEFLEELQSLDDLKEAIIFHINILTEGIDVPGITGIMPLTNLKLSRFLQTLGRATRLYLNDRIKIYNKELEPSDTEEFIKAYAWILIPFYNEIGEDIKNSIFEMTTYLRTFGFNPREDIVIKQLRGRAIPDSLENINEKDTRAKALFDIALEVEHSIETEETANKLNEEVYTIIEELKNKPIEELFKFYESL